MEPLALEMSRAEARSLWSRGTLGLPQFLWTRLWSRKPGVGLHPFPLYLGRGPTLCVGRA